MSKYFVILAAICLLLVIIEILFTLNNRYYDNASAVIVNSDSHQPDSVNPYQPVSSGFGSYKTGLIVHSAYFDERPRNNHSNVTVIFITVNLTLWKDNGIVGCGIKSTNASSFQVYSPMENVQAHKGLDKHAQENLAILCYDLPVCNGSIIYVFQKAAVNSPSIVRLQSEYPVFFPTPRIRPAGEDHITVVTCIKVHNRHSRLLKEIIQYQKTIGVDHVFINALNTFVEDGGYHDIILNDTELNKLYEEGYISIKIWTNEIGLDTVVNSEVIRKLECTYRFRGTYDYVMPLDTDDFFVPRVSGKTKLRDYIKDYCYVKPVASCQFVWVWLFPECGLTSEVGPDGNITNHLKSYAYDDNPHLLNYKSVHNFTHLWDNGFHDAVCENCLMPGYTTVIVPTHIAYVAHIRYGLRYGFKIDLNKVCKRKEVFQNIRITKDTPKHIST